MAVQAHLDILAQGVEAWNLWRERNPSIKPDFSEAYLPYADLPYADLSGAYLPYADLSGAKLTGADLSGADLSGAKLTGAFLARADLFKAVLHLARLWEAILYQANLSGADLRGGANLSGAFLAEADLSYANLSGADLTEANLSDADLTRSSLVKTNLTGTNLTGCNIYGISAWSLNLKDAKQWNLNISDVNEPAVMVDDLEVAQFVYLLLNHKKLRNVLNAITERGVLILGRFGGGGLEILEAIAAKLRESKYQPFIFDFDRPADRNYTETVKTLVGLSRFVIVDLSGPSVPQELYATVPHFKIPFVPIVEEGRRQYSMVVDILEAAPIGHGRREGRPSQR